MVILTKIEEAEDEYAQYSHPKICCNLRFCYCCGRELVGKSVIPLLCRDCGNTLRDKGKGTDEERQQVWLAVRTRRL
jgi:hypothetical protein